jgi:hypothetical protein
VVWLTRQVGGAVTKEVGEIRGIGTALVAHLDLNCDIEKIMLWSCCAVRVGPYIDSID